VTADGKLVHASEDENADLFWGLRGAGANFGIVTSLEYRLHPVDRVITHGVLTQPLDRVGELAALFRDEAESAPDELSLGFGMSLDDDGQPIAYITVLHCGSLADAERDLARLRAFDPDAAASIAAKPYLTTQTMNDERMRWGHRFYMKSALLPDLSDEVVDRFAAHVSRIPAGAEAEFTGWAMGRAIAAVPDDATAFTGRAAGVWIAAEIFWDEESIDDACRSWVRASLADIQEFVTTGRYVNDVAEIGDDVTRSVYGDAKYERLVGLKRTWDPDNVFRLNQNIRP
jgi:FAD/FMN-containing dehydrogenase